MLSSKRVWRTYPGGMKLDLMEGREHPVDAHFPEDWIVFTTLAINKGREHLIEEGLSKVTVADNPPLGQAYFYFVTARNLLGEDGTKGNGTNNTRPNPNPCP